MDNSGVGVVGHAHPSVALTAARAIERWAKAGDAGGALDAAPAELFAFGDLWSGAELAGSAARKLGDGTAWVAVPTVEVVAWE